MNPSTDLTTTAPDGERANEPGDALEASESQPVHDAAVEATQSRIEEIAHPDEDDQAPDNSPLGRFKRSRYRSVAAFGSALLIGGILAPLVIRPPASGPVAPALTWEMALPASATARVEQAAAPGAALRGQVAPVADITGKAPVGGAVARWVVEPGARVEAGQAVVQITSGPSTRAPLPGESQQIIAEKQQTEAADDQMALAQKLSATQEKLRATQERVARAQDEIGEARALIQRLRAGEVVPAAPTGKSAKAPRTETRPNPQLAAARAKTEDAQRQVADALAKLAAARTDASGAQKSLAALQSKVDEAQSNLKTVEAKFDGSLASAADLQTARLALANARDTLKVATARGAGAQKQIPILEKQLAERQSALEAARAAQNQLPATLTEGATQSDAPAAPAASSAVSLEDAVKRANDALAQSRAATREAERLRAQVDQYQKQAQSSNARIESATKVLENSQTRPLPSVPRVRFTNAHAPAGGVVVWIARLAREVGAGQSVFGLASGKRFVARFEDKTDSWKNARVGQTVSALVAPPTPNASAPNASAPNADSAAMPVEFPAPGAKSSTTATPKPATPPALSAQTASELGARSIKVKLTRIAPPEAPGEPAILEGELVAADATAGPNWQLLASLPDPTKASILTVPAGALVQRDNKTYVAVLEEETVTKIEGVSTQATPTEAAPGEATPTEAAPRDAPQFYRLQWQEVRVGEQVGVARQVKSGLEAGQRIVTDPLPLLAQAPPSAPALPRVKLSNA